MLHGTLVRGGPDQFRDYIMFKKPDYQLEYVYNKNRFKRTIWLCVIFWILTRIARAIMYFTVGVMAFGGIPAAFIFFFSGLIFGIATMSIIVYRKSVRVQDIEDEKARLLKK
jgi:hypothetical protein